MNLTSIELLQIEQAARGLVSGTSDEWPSLVIAIEKIRGKKLEHRKSAAWLQGFCEAILIGENDERLLDQLDTRR